jgi:hypothetical protein
MRSDLTRDGRGEAEQREGNGSECGMREQEREQAKGRQENIRGGKMAISDERRS